VFKTELNGTTLTSAGGYDGFVVKYRADGQFIWGISLGGQYDDDAPALALDGNGDLYVTGDINNVANYSVSGGMVSPVHIGAVALPNALTAYYGGLFVAKLNAGNGGVQWVKELDSNGLGASGDGIAADSAGNAYIAGNFFGTVDFDPSPNVHTQTDPTNLGSSGFVLKLDPLGQFVWVNQVTDPFGAGPGCFAMDPADGTLYAAGNFETHADFVGSGVGLDVTPGAAKSLYLAKYSPSDGSLVWARAFASMAVSDTGAAGLGVDAAGNAYVTGRFVGTDVDFDPTQSYMDNHDLLTDTLPGNNPNLFVARYGAAGNFDWATTVDGPAFGRGVAVDDSGTPYVTGDIHGPIDFGSQSFNGAGNGNTFVAKMNPGDGSFVCATASKNLTPNADRCYAIAVDHKGFVDTAGFYAATAQFGSKVLPTSAGDSDVFIVKQKLECHVHITLIAGDILQVQGDDSSNRIGITDDGNGGITVAVDDDTPLTYTGIDKVVADTGNGNDVFSYTLLPASTPGELLPMVRPADLTVKLGDGDNTLLVEAHNGWGEPPSERPWHIDVTGGVGVGRSTFLFGGRMGNLDLEDRLAAKKDTVDVTINPAAPQEALDAFLKMNIFGGAGANTVRATIGGDQVSGPGPINRALLGTAVDLHFMAGLGLNALDVAYRNVTIAAPQMLAMTGVQGGAALRMELHNAVVNAPLAVGFAGPGGDPGSTVAFDNVEHMPVPMDGSLLMTDRGGPFADDIRVIYAFNPVPEPPGMPSDLSGTVEFHVPHGDPWGALFEIDPPRPIG
jgi:hypothetical protein